MSRPVSNICFHGIGTPRRPLEPGESTYWVDVPRFHALLDEIATWSSARISFDDGNESDVDIALPALVSRGLRADFFVLAGRLGAAGSVDAAGVRELRRQGMTIGTHGMAHRSWRGLDPAARREELVDAREALAEVAGEPVDLAACPLGRYDRRLLSELRKLDYRGVFTSDRRPARRDAWLQPRFSVRRDDTPESLRAEALAPAPLSSRLKGLAKRLR